ncbi:MAG TPA: NAD(P)/FAD-dependent oxidoreductase [Solirubrobacteraceae bacterium]|jgi:NADH dehydrogenase
MTASTATHPGHVVVVGGGFAGLQATKALARAGAEVTLIDRNNYHLFQPLSYQVATGALSPGEIAIPLRHVFRRRDRVRVLLGEVSEFDLARRRLIVTDPDSNERVTLAYDQLVVAGGSDYSYFGHEDWRSVALEVKSLDSALEVRGRILHAFEAAELKPDEQEAWLTFLVVGAGPTGVEMAGQIAELSNDTLPREYRAIDTRRARVLLVETADKVLAAFPDPLPDRAATSLEQLGVTLMLGHTVVDVGPEFVTVEDDRGSRTRVPTRTVVWAAGVTASPVAKLLADAAGAGVDHAGRLTVEPDLSVPGHPEVLALGDMVNVREPGSGAPKTYPGLAPVAMQQGRYAGKAIAARLAGGPEVGPFRYRDKGMLATIGRDQAVAEVWKLRFSGRLAWLAWLVVHIYYLIGFANRIVVLLQWADSYVTRGRGSRLITEAADLPSHQRPGVAAQDGRDPSQPATLRRSDTN